MIREFLSSTLVWLTLIAASGSIHAQTNVTFDNANGGDWNTPTNWSTQFVPEVGFSEIAIVNNDTTVTLQDVLDNVGPPENGRQGPGGFSLGGTATRVEILDAALLTVAAGDDSNGATAINGGTLNLQGNGRLVTESFSVGGSGTIEYSVSGSSNFNVAPIGTTGAASLNGQFVANFGPGTGLSVGETLNVIDAGSISGAFTSFQATGQELPIGQQYQFIPSSGGNGTILGLTVLQKAVLTIDRQTGGATLQNLGSVPVELDALTIESAAGNIDNAAFMGLPAQQWITSPGSANRITQLRSAGVEILGPGASFALGNIFAPQIPEFGTPIEANEDLQLIYSNSAAAEISGVVQFVGESVANNMLLSIDPESGAAFMKNDSSFTIELEGYTVTSELGFLTPATWNSFEDQGLNEGNWDDSLGSDAGRLTELIKSGVATIGPNQQLDLGSIYDVSGLAADPADSLNFEILLSRAGTPNVITGVVRFEVPPTGLPGDYNDDGVVDAVDYTIWRNNLGATDESALNGNGDGINGVGPGDYDLWAANFGSTGAVGLMSSSAVPEPSTMCLFLFTLFVWSSYASRRKYQM